ncbi:TerD family protein [Clostridium botulinum D/C]|uniref:TerD family protein n=1 Tax=Clostridium botulinum TaxID=1491 RepID=UPI001E36070B|nr:TerD family protein [Clostridium botulinum]MCD3351834.1 TerD family protein [Clostridium botulinum D/C]MCD3360760.1 TerD family protein [Clostridium botulinum D/C]MCD3363039.1 TerD family protein [Clostridium botulinum D/C]MCD3366538.1 TerD family protein [Clostridium botulinum D/C]
MAINLKKGQRISLTKEDATLSRIIVGLGWDPVKQGSGKGIFGSLFGSSAPDIDCDASVIMLNKDNKIQSKEDLIYFGNLSHISGSVQHMGDNLTGDGDGDDEQILLELSKIPSNIEKLIFVVNIYNCVKRNQHFGMIKNAFIRIMNLQNNKEMLRFNLTDDYSNKTGIYVAEIYRHESEWKFAAIGQGHTVAGLQDMINKYR